MHETDRCRSLKFLVEKLVKVEHLRRHIKGADHIEESRPTTNIIIAEATTPSEPRPVINYILSGLSNYQYQSERQQKKILKAATIKVRVKAIHTKGSREETRLIDGLISFPLVNPNKIIVPHCHAFCTI